MLKIVEDIFDIQILDGEVRGLEQHIKKALTFDIVHPVMITGTLGNFDTELTIIMSNSDQIRYSYEEPFDNRDVTHFIEINGGRVIDAGEMSNEPLQFIRDEYKKHLLEKIKKV